TLSLPTRGITVLYQVPYYKATKTLKPIEISTAYDILAVLLFDNIKLFRDIAQWKSVSRGASHNGISQSAASQHIHELEKKLGMALLDRTTRPLALTPAGKLYLDLCRDVQRREEEFQTELDELK